MNAEGHGCRARIMRPVKRRGLAMIENGIRMLEAGGPDHSLSGLEADIWARVEAHEKARRRSVRLLVVQTALLCVAFGANALLGHYERMDSSRPSDLSVFSPQTPLSATTLLGEGP